MGVRVLEARCPAEMRRFIRFPLSLYAGDPLYVPHLNAERRRFFSDRNPIFEFIDRRYLLAVDEDGRTVGRVTAHLNRRQNRYWDERAGCFGFLECVEEPEVAGALLGEAERWLASEGMELVRGPLNFSTNEECGLLIEGFDRPPAIMMPYNKRYYPALLERLGYGKAKDLLAYGYDYPGEIPAHLARFAERASKRLDVRVRPVSMAAFEQDVSVAFEVYNRAWADNWGFVPMTRPQFEYMAEELKAVVDPDLVLIAEMDGQAVGFSLALPDLNPVLKKMKGRLLPFGVFRFVLGRRSVDRVRVLTMGVVREHRRRGINTLLIYETFRRGLPKGYVRGEFSWVLEDNVLERRALERIGAEVSKTYRIYEKPL